MRMHATYESWMLAQLQRQSQIVHSTFVNCLQYCRFKATILVQVARTIAIDYEPAGLTMHPPPQNDLGWVHFFRIGV